MGSLVSNFSAIMCPAFIFLQGGNVAFRYRSQVIGMQPGGRDRGKLQVFILRSTRSYDEDVAQRFDGRGRWVRAVHAWRRSGSASTLLRSGSSFSFLSGDLAFRFPPVLIRGIPRCKIEPLLRRRTGLLFFPQRFEAGDDVEQFLIDATLAQTMKCPVEVLQ